VRSSPDFESISLAFKRMKNILRQARDAGKPAADVIDEAVLEEAAERELAAEIAPSAAAVQALRAQRNYEQALVEISKLRPAVDKFFDHVMVMAEDDRIRRNRLALLQTLVKEFTTIADFSEIVTEGTKESPK
jgi:glycyl-tRNA synthetase beta chain